MGFHQKICMVVLTPAFFSAYVSKNRYFSSFSLAAVNTSQFASLDQNMILIILHLQICSWRVKLSKKRKNLDFPDFVGIFYQDILLWQEL